MANNQPPSLGDVNSSLAASNLQMNPAVAAQIAAAQGGAGSTPPPNVTPPPTGYAGGNFDGLGKKIDNLSSKITALAKVIQQNTLVLRKNNPGTTTNNSNDLSENQIEAQKVQDYQTKLLEKIEENTRGGGGGNKQDNEPNSPKLNLTQIGLLATLIAGALGTIAGVLTAYAKVIVKAFAGTGLLILNVLKKTGELLIKLIPDSVKSLVFKMINSISIMIDILIINIQHGIGTLIELFKNRFPKAFTFVTNAIESVKTFAQKTINVAKNVMQAIVNFAEKAMDFAKAAITKIANVFISVKDAVVNFFKPIVAAFGEIKSASSTVGGIVSKISKGVSEVGSFFSKIAGWMGSFATVFKAFAVIGEKIAIPLTIIMGLYEGISDSIDEFKKSGDILNTIGAFLKGFLNSAVGSVLDLFKNIISWAMGALGFDKVEEILDSFSFSDVISGLVDHMINGVKIIIDWVKSIGDAIYKFASKFNLFSDSNLTPNKTKSVNPLDPANTSDFNKLNKQNQVAIAELDDPTKYNRLGQPIKPAAPTNANSVYNQSSQVASADKTKQMPAVASIVSAPTVVNNRTNQQAFIKSPIRNPDNTLNSYVKARYNT